MGSCLYVLLLGVCLAGADPAPPAAPIEVPAMLLKLIEQVDVPAREAGPLASLSVGEGQMVEAGQVLAQIEDAEARILQDRAKLEFQIAQGKAQNDVSIRFARKSVEVAKAELQRAADSNAKYPKSISESEMDRLRLLVEKSTLETEQAEHDFRMAGLTAGVKQTECRAAEEKLRRHTIVAPLAGVVAQVSRQRGEWVKPGDAVVRILRLDRLRAEGFLKAQHLSPGLQGCEVKLVVDLPDRPGAEFPAKIVFLDPEIDPLNAQGRVWAEVENRQLSLRPGMRARMIIGPQRQVPGAARDLPP